MMTGYGYNSNLVQQAPVIPRVGEEWSQVAGQSQYFHTESGATGLTNPMYGSMSGWYQAPNGFSMPLGGVQQQLQHQPLPEGMAPPPHIAMMQAAAAAAAASLAPPPLPRISISDEELYQALNMSPLPPPGFSHVQPHLQTDYLSSDVCFPSTSSFESSGYHDQNYPPQENLQNYHHEGDDEESFGEPERFDTMSPTFSIHSFAPMPYTNVAEAEDLEVELINNQKPTPRYQLADDIDMFLHTGTTDDTEYNEDSDSRPTTTYSHRSTKAPTPPASRPAYAQKLTAAAHNQKTESSSEAVSPKTSPLFLQTSVQPPAGFTPLLTPNSDALLQRKLSEAVHNPPPRPTGLNAFPAFPQNPPPPHLIRFQENQNYDIPHFQKLENQFVGNKEPVKEDYFPKLLDAFAPIQTFDQIRQAHFDPFSVPVDIPDLHLLTDSSTEPTCPTSPAGPIGISRLSDQELETESQKLALDVISNLFTNKKEIIDRAKVINAPKKPVARNLFCHDKESLDKARSSDPIEMSVLDDWETADDEDLTGRMENLLKDVKKEEKKTQSAALSKAALLPPINRMSDWDPTFLQHVLEIYGVPDYKMQEDVVKAMETIGNGDCKVMWMERKVVFAVFESVQRAKNCLTLSKHDWLRFRSLSDSPIAVQESAKSNATSLAIPKKKQQTTATVARRMVENALGKKATISTEKRQEERNKLAAARAAKKNVIQWD